MSKTNIILLVIVLGIVAFVAYSIVKSKQDQAKEEEKTKQIQSLLQQNANMTQAALNSGLLGGIGNLTNSVLSGAGTAFGQGGSGLTSFLGLFL